MTLAAAIITSDFAVLGADDLLTSGEPDAYQLKLWPAGRLGWMAWAGDAAFGHIALAYLNAFQTVEDQLRLLQEPATRARLADVLKRSASDLSSGIEEPARWIFEEHVDLVNQEIGSFRIPETRIAVVGPLPEGAGQGHWRLDLLLRDHRPSPASVEVQYSQTTDGGKPSAKVLFSGGGFNPERAENRLLEASTSEASAKSAIVAVIQERALEERAEGLASRVNDEGHILTLGASGVVLERFTAAGDLLTVTGPLNHVSA